MRVVGCLSRIDIRLVRYLLNYNSLIKIIISRYFVLSVCNFEWGEV